MSIDDVKTETRKPKKQQTKSNNIAEWTNKLWSNYSSLCAKKIRPCVKQPQTQHIILQEPGEDAKNKTSRCGNPGSPQPGSWWRSFGDWWLLAGWSITSWTYQAPQGQENELTWDDSIRQNSNSKRSTSWWERNSHGIPEEQEEGSTQGQLAHWEKEVFWTFFFPSVAVHGFLMLLAELYMAFIHVSTVFMEFLICFVDF